LPDIESAVSPNLKSGMMKICVLETKDLWQTFFFRLRQRMQKILVFGPVKQQPVARRTEMQQLPKCEPRLISSSVQAFPTSNDEEEVGAYNRRE
jgi:hypothetical protein